MEIKPLTKLDIVLSVFNQENLIERVLYGIFKNTTTPFNLIMVFDGCTDRTESRARAYIQKHTPKHLREFIATHANNVFETRANNIGFKLAKEDYMITLQDDMVVNEYGWERRMTYPLRKFDDVLAVSSRAAQDIDDLVGEHDHNYTNRAARELGTLTRDTFAVRDIINRGPVAFNMAHFKKMNFLNDAYAPSDLDDADLSLRAWKQYKLRVGAYWIDYLSPLHWGKARAADSTMHITGTISRNAQRIMNDHSDYLSTKIKHDEDIKIPESEIDYVGTRPYAFPYIHRKIRIHKKEVKRQWGLVKNLFKEFTLKTFEICGVKNVRERGIKKIVTFKK
jgi:glycosyltransferase involved in cell wall biosynthesis